MDISLEEAFHREKVQNNQAQHKSLSRMWKSSTQAQEAADDVMMDIKAHDESLHSTETLSFIQKLIGETLQLKKTLEESQYQQQKLGAAEAMTEKLLKENASLQIQLQGLRHKSTRPQRNICWHHLYSKCRFGTKCWYEHPKVQQPTHSFYSRKSNASDHSKSWTMHTHIKEKHEEARSCATTVREAVLKKAKSLRSTKITENAQDKAKYQKESIKEKTPGNTKNVTEAEDSGNKNDFSQAKEGHFEDLKSNSKLGAEAATETESEIIKADHLITATTRSTEIESTKASKSVPQADLTEEESAKTEIKEVHLRDLLQKVEDQRSTAKMLMKPMSDVSNEYNEKTRQMQPWEMEIFADLELTRQYSRSIINKMRNEAKEKKERKTSIAVNDKRKRKT